MAHIMRAKLSPSEAKKTKVALALAILTMDDEQCVDEDDLMDCETMQSQRDSCGVDESQPNSHAASQKSSWALLQRGRLFSRLLSGKGLAPSMMDLTDTEVESVVLFAREVIMGYIKRDTALKITSVIALFAEPLQCSDESNCIRRYVLAELEKLLSDLLDHIINHESNESVVYDSRASASAVIAHLARLHSGLRNYILSRLFQEVYEFVKRYTEPFSESATAETEVAPLSDVHTRGAENIYFVLETAHSIMVDSNAPKWSEWGEVRNTMWPRQLLGLLRWNELTMHFPLAANALLRIAAESPFSTQLSEEFVANLMQQ